MVICLFGFETLPGMEGAEERLTKKLEPILRRTPGFISYKDYQAADGEWIGVVRFESEGALRMWIDEGVHGRAQKIVNSIYASFWVQTAETYREYVWQGGVKTAGDLTGRFREPRAS
jgi:heme-degrading monooxygenase HmoA